MTSVTVTNVTTQLFVGARGVHMGWFRNNPQLQTLPEGTMLDAQKRANGLMRWVLVMPENTSPSKVQSIETWLMQQGIVDAYEVHRNVDGWSTTKPSAEDVVLNEAKRPPQFCPPHLRRPKPKQKARTTLRKEKTR